MSCENLRDLLAQCRGLFHQHILQCPEKLREFLFRPIQNVLREQSTAGAKFPQANPARRTQHAPHLFELPRQQSPEYRMHVTRCEEISCLAKLTRIAGVVPEFGMIETQLHVSRKRNRTVLPNLFFNDCAWAANSPFFWRSSR